MQQKLSHLLACSYQWLVTLFIISIVSCTAQHVQQKSVARILPSVITDTVLDDSDDPAIWINAAKPSHSIVLGTDKNKKNGGVYPFTLAGKIIKEKVLLGLKRVNNIDVAYGLQLNKSKTDIAVFTERNTNSVRVISMPDMQYLDNGTGIPVFVGDSLRSPMGIATYTDAATGSIYFIVSRKTGPKENYLEQYVLGDDGTGSVTAKLVRKFGKFSGKKEIESVAVDNELGYVYYSDEQFGIRKYYANPKMGNEELAVFAQHDFSADSEGISIYKFDDGTGYILISNQSNNSFNVYPREGTTSNRNEHKKIVSIPVSTNQSDGSDITSTTLPNFKGGLFVAMSDNKTFQFYSWERMAKPYGLRVK